ncbi:MAG: hypothetical protein SVM80_01990 [Halobacteriota archaeon]|nr:hypothetical protein [Halobacteriota archaeon]
MKAIRSISFDTSFLLKESSDVDKIIKKLKKDGLACYVTSTVISELEQLKVWGRIDERSYGKAMSRWKRVNGKIIRFSNVLVSTELRKECATSMEEHHGVKPENIINDCNILIVSLKNGVDLFLSEDFHFTSKVTEDVLREVKSNACIEYSLMCGGEMYCVDAKTFLMVYNDGKIDTKTIETSHKYVKKAGKRLVDVG